MLALNFRVRVVALLGAIAFFAGCLAPAAAAPALWLVQSPTAKVYLFGTVHLLRDNVPWLSPEVRAAMNDSQNAYLEVADPTDRSAVLAPLMKLGFDPQHPLSTKISSQDVAQLDLLAKKYGLGSEALFEPMQPWAVFMVLSTLPATHSGYAPGNGVDVNVRKDFIAAGKPVQGLETPLDDLHIFSDLPEKTQITLLEASLRASNDASGSAVKALDGIVTAWMSGNQDALASAMDWSKLSTGPMYDAMLVRRNHAWVDELSERLKGTGTSFVSVGAAHMLGNDGLPALLKQRGFSVVRVPTTDATAAPAGSATPQPSSSPIASPVSSPTASPTPVPATFSPPPGWKARTPTPFRNPYVKLDALWVDPAGHGTLVASHLDMPGGNAGLDLDAFGAMLQMGMGAAPGVTKVSPYTKIKICGDKQDGLYIKSVGAKNVDVVAAISDHAYQVQYVRSGSIADDPAALRALLTLCAP